MTRLDFTEEWFRDYQRRTGLGEHGKKDDGNPSVSPSASHLPLHKGGTGRSKYGNTRTERDGRRFDSKHEADVYDQLQLRVRAGELRGIVCQQPFLLPGGVKYIADFVALKNDGTYDVIDAKSVATRKDKVYRIKRRQMKEVLGIEIVEV